MSKELPTAKEIIEKCLKGEISIVTAIYVCNAPLQARIDELNTDVKLLKQAKAYSINQEQRLKSENERYKKALERIQLTFLESHKGMNHVVTGCEWEMTYIAKEALKET